MFIKTHLMQYIEGVDKNDSIILYLICHNLLYVGFIFLLLIVTILKLILIYTRFQLMMEKIIICGDLNS